MSVRVAHLVTPEGAMARCGASGPDLVASEAMLSPERETQTFLGRGVCVRCVAIALNHPYTEGRLALVSEQATKLRRDLQAANRRARRAEKAIAVARKLMREASGSAQVHPAYRALDWRRR